MAPANFYKNDINLIQFFDSEIEKSWVQAMPLIFYKTRNNQNTYYYFFVLTTRYLRRWFRLIHVRTGWDLKGWKCSSNDRLHTREGVEPLTSLKGREHPYHSLQDLLNNFKWFWNKFISEKSFNLCLPITINKVHKLYL